MARRCMWVFAILLTALLVTGCGPKKVTVKPQTWTVGANSYSFADTLTSFVDHLPDPGFKWLVINVCMYNNTNKEQNLNWFMDQFQFVAANGNTYDMRFTYTGIPGNLPQLYPPQEMRRGDVYFHVPEGTDVRAGKLLFSPWQEELVTISLQGLPSTGY